MLCADQSLGSSCSIPTAHLHIVGVLLPERPVGVPPLRHLIAEGMNTDRAGVGVVLDPGFFKGCSHR